MTAQRPTPFLLRTTLMLTLVGSLVAVFGGCDDPKQNCLDVANKYDECAPKIIEQAIQSVPDTFKPAIEQAKEQQAAAVKKVAADLRAQCQGAKFSEAERKQFRLWRQCLAKGCDEFTKCITGK